MAWASWKKILEEYGEEEGKERVKAGLILTRRDPEATKKGVKIWQFLKVDERVQVSRQASQKVQTEAQGQTDKKQHKALTKAIQSLQPGEEDDAAFDQMWLAKKPKHVALEDCEVTASEDEGHMEEEEDEAVEKEQFLAEIGAASSSKPKKKAEAWNKAKAAAKKAKEKKEIADKEKEAKKAAFAAAKQIKWTDKIEKLSNCADNLVKKNISKMTTLILPEIRESKKMVKVKADKGLQESLEKLQTCSDNLENALLDAPDMEEAKNLLKTSAQLLKDNKKMQEEYDVA